MSRNTTYATGMVNPKTTALFFDKLWVFPTLIDVGIPKDVCMNVILRQQDFLRAARANSPFTVTPLMEARQQMPKQELDRIEVFDEIRKWNIINPFFFSSNQPVPVEHRNEAIYKISSFYRQKKGIDLVPLYFCSQDFEEVNKMETVGLQLCLDLIPMVDETKLDWLQVVEFRKDEEAREKLLRLRRWFTTDLIGKDKDEAQAIIEKKLDDYKWALKKHSIQTFVGGLTSVIPVLVGPSFIQLVKSSQLEIALGGLALAAGAVAWISTKMIEKQGIKRDEVAYIYEVQKLAKK